MKKLDAESVTMICIQFCEEKQLLNREMSLSTIEYIRYDLDEAIAKLRELVQTYGSNEDRTRLSKLEPRLALLSQRGEQFEGIKPNEIL